jgi:hypothetical protein
MHTYKNAKGEFYDDVQPHNEEDIALPLRPSLIHRWNGRNWVWVGKKISNTFPPRSKNVERNVERHTSSHLRDLAALVQETAEIQSHQSYIIEQLRISVSQISRTLTAHIEEERPLLETLRGLKAIGKASEAISSTLNGAANMLRGLWRVAIFVLASSIFIVAISNDNPSEIKHVFKLIFG